MRGCAISKRYLSLFRAFYEYNHKKIRLSTKPQITDIEITNDCNLNCRSCSRQAVIKHRGIGYMQLGVFKEIVDKYNSLMVHPRLFFHGEPTLHADLPEMVQYMNDKCRHIRSLGTQTNGLLMNVQLFKQLVDCGLNDLGFSFEGTDKETYEYLRRGADFDKVQTNIREVCEYNFKYGNKVHISLNIIDTRQTHDKLPQFIEKWNKIQGLQEITVAKLGDWTKTLNVDDMKVAETKKCALEQCPTPWFTINILWNGWVVPCCGWNYTPLGNICTETIEEIWNGERFVELRKVMTKGRYTHGWCKNCSGNGFSPPNSLYCRKPSKAYPFNLSFLKQCATTLAGIVLTKASKLVYA